MTTFAELRERFSPDENVRGKKQFEPLCKWFLETDPRYSDRLVNVWLWDDWPGRWGPESGIDLVAEDRDGKNWAIQAKCYDPDHTVTKTDMNKFLSESINENIHHRLLIATTNRVGKTAQSVIHRQNKVHPISQLLLADLEAAPVVWPSNPDRPHGGGPRKRLTPKPHQRSAIKNVVKNLNKRGQMIMACGTGKTLAALWISERLEAKRTLVLVPSLTLLSETLSVWLANAKEPFAYVPVCSDDTASTGNDATVMFTADLGYPVTTDSDEIAAFLRRHGRQVVFSTYQSSPQVAEAQMRSRVPGFDLVIADEAHRCAGKVSPGYGTVLDDKEIRAKKRLFMTATPRTYTATVRKKAGDKGVEVASMDDDAVFGPVLHELNFGEAIEKGLLTDYQVVVVGVDEGRYKQMIDQRRIVKTDKGLQTDAMTLAKHVALAKAIRDYDLRQIITFHSRVEAAQAFANTLPKVVSWMPPRHQPKTKPVTDHVNGKMSTGERIRRINRLRNIESGQSAVLTNAQCLSEGIDVPTLDGVAFIDPRRSQVDIIQAVGRAIRHSDEKTLGTIIIPVFLSNTDDPDTALSQSEFEPVWSIVRALRSHDNIFGKALDGIRTELGRKGGGYRLPPKIKLDLPKDVPGGFAAAFTTRLVEATTQKWNFNFGLLQKYVAREGHSGVPVSHVELFEGGEFRLGNWINFTRTRFKWGELSINQIESLETVAGWVWDQNEADYQKGFLVLEGFVAREGHARPLKSHIEVLRGSEFQLGTWVGNRKKDYRNGQLSPERIAALTALPGWTWDTKESRYQEHFMALEAFVAREGHARPPSSHVEEFNGSNYSLGVWVVSRRGDIRKGQLSPERIAALTALPGWTLNTTLAAFDSVLAVLKAFVAREGHARVHQSHVEESKGSDYQLGTWTSNQRTKFRNGRLSPEQITALASLPGWEWKPPKGPRSHKR